MTPLKIKLNSVLLLLGYLLFASCNQKPIDIHEFSSDVLVDWNQKVMEIAVAEDGLLTLKGLRTATMMHIAAHDALNSVSRQYTHYTHTEETASTEPVATASYALHYVASHEYPDKKEVFDQILQEWLKGSTDDLNIAKSLGENSAKAILNKRNRDAWNGEAEYTWHPMAPGVYAEFNEHSGTPDGFVFGSGWAKAQPFTLPKPDYFRVPPPPSITSTAYTQAFNEVKEVGNHNSTTRTIDQTHLALWWKDFVENSHNRLLRDLVQKEKMNLWEAARVFALMNMAVYDAYINVFDNKFHYNHWRPYTAIRWAEHDKNPDTEADLEWNNLHKHTYPFPSYPSAHGTASSAAMKVLAETLGKGNTYDFTMTTETVESAGPFSDKIVMDPPTRSFSSFSEAGLEASLSRVYLGIHFRYDSEEGHRLGNQIGEYTTMLFLKPLD